MSTELIPLILAAETVALVPAHALSWHRVQLPPGTLGGGMFKERSAPRLRAVLEGLLEDHLLDDPATLHFALQPQPRTDAPVWVAVCDRAWLRDAIESLTRLGRPPQRLVPEWTPDSPTGQLWVTGTEDAPQAVWTDAQGLHRVPLPQTADAGTAGWAQARDSYALWAEPVVAALAETTLNKQPHVESHTERLQRAALSAWDLAQFDLARRNPLFERIRRAALSFVKADQWKPARWALVAIALVQIVGLNAYAWHTNSQLQAQRDRVRNTLATTFPQVKVVVDAPIQMERELALLRQTRGAASAKDLESMLAALGSANPALLPAGGPGGVEYSNGEMRVGGMALTTEQSTAMDQQLRSRGLTAQAEGTVVLVRTRGTP
ncbi:MAG: general secretion pathway protein GspL [Rhodoferax sp.]|nr:general secretion pathway protein GspL [Rhodoferax sp.]